MSKLNWYYSGDEQRAEYRGFIIRAAHDSDSENPIECWDGHWPMIVGGSRDNRQTVYDRTKGGVPVDAPLDRFTDEQLVHDQIAIATTFGTTISELLSSGLNAALKYSRDADLLRRMFEDELGNVPDSHRLAHYALLYALLGIAHLETTVHGYSQGDQQDVLIVATPEAIKEMRPDVTPEDLTKDMQSQADLYEAWAYGNVWGYVIEDVAGAAIPDGVCFGYYGDVDDSGLEEAAIEAVDCHLDACRRARQTKLKELIRNRVPLHLRPHLLEEAA